ncbi:hypothetical protein EX30DRAFT_337660 [Ascodesmis nigricans]|uniref:tRNA/rRNA methyltransferase SpoU type domain-containing protein n=1 Tax=Ascodesmis nigricans TaxID=341454 RepID=A0A4S2N7F2_9PEZI|nr:hypothetical protein EX30DRAFT_337660 [Ascodesmis nigricans]
MAATDIYESIARSIVSSACSAAQSISIGPLLAAELERNPQGADALQVARTLRQVLQVERESDEKEKARKILHAYTASLLQSPSAIPNHERLGLVAALCDDQLLMKLLNETVQALKAALQFAAEAHPTSDDAFAVNLIQILAGYLPSSFSPIDQTQAPNSTSSGGETGVPQHGKLLEFWNMLFTTEHWRSFSPGSLRPVADQLPALLLMTSGLRDEKIATAALGVMGALVRSSSMNLDIHASEMIWKAVRPLLSASVHVDAVLTLWLRWIDAENPIVQPQLEVLQSEEYWMFIQTGLATGFSERRKYAMYLLMNSLSKIPQGHKIDTRIMKLPNGPTNKTKTTWAKYTTLLEITSLSTSPNQLRDAMPDIKRLLDSSSDIPASWMVILVALGFQSGSSSVQRTMWEFITELEGRQLAKLFGEIEGRRFLRDILLPYSSTGNLFNVRISNPSHCGHGLNLSNFLQRLLKSLDHSAKECAMVLLENLDTRADALFPPARIFILKGLCDGVKDIKFLEQNYLDRLVGIARMRRAAKLKVDIAISAILRLILHADVEMLGLDAVLGCVAEVALDKLYLMTPDYVDALSQHLNSLGTEKVIPHLESVIRSTTDMNISSEGPTMNALYKEVVSLLVLGYTDKTSEFFKEWRSQSLLAYDVNRLRVMTLLASAQNIYPRIFTMLVGSADNALQPFAEFAANRVAPEHRPYLVQYLHALGSDSRVLGCVQPGLRCEQESALLKTARLTWGAIKNWDSASATTEWKVMSKLAYLCSESYRIMNTTNTVVSSPSFEELLKILSTVSAPTLGQNKHDNLDMTSGFEKYTASLFQLLQLTVLNTAPENISSTLVATTLDMLPKFLRFMEHESVLMAINFIISLATKVPGTLKAYPNLPERIQQLWEIADVSNRADTAKVNHAFISMLLHANILGLTSENEDMSEAVTSTITVLFEKAVGKRSIRPKISKALRDAFLAAPDTITRCNWLIDVILHLIEMPTIAKDPDFYLEEAIAGIFDELMPFESDDTPHSLQENHYQLYNGDPELFSRVYACDLLSRMNPGNTAQSEFVHEVRNRLFEPWKKNFLGMQVYVAWKKASALQTLVLTENFVARERAEGFLDELFEMCLAHEPHPRYRFQMEWIVALCFIRHPELRDKLWSYARSVAIGNPKLMSSVIKVGLMVARELSSQYQEEFFTELVYTVLPLTSNSKAGLRHHAIAMVLELWEDANRFNFTVLTSNPIFSRIYTAIVGSTFYKEHADQKDFRTFNPKENLSFAGIFAGSYLQGGDEVQTVPPMMFEAATTGVSDSPSSIPVFTTSQIEQLSKTSTSTTIPAGKVEYKATLSSDLLAAASPTPLQTKSQSWDVSSLLRTSTSSQPSTTPTPSSTYQVILVASLIDKPVNLGGLSRVSEIMGVSTLIVSDLALTKKPDFLSTSVHSESWLPMEEVKIDGVPEYLRKVRTQGWEIVGIEQTDSSVILGKDEVASGDGKHGRRFGGKTVLVLGTERFGMPPEVLTEMDWCVEIPQVGVTRSMNVQTAAAVVLFEWRRQVG